MNDRERISGKIIQWNYDTLAEASEEKCCFSLSERDIQIMLAITDTIGWKTRFYSPEGGDIEQDTINNWKNGLEHNLMTGCCGDELVLYRLTEEGKLEKSTDDGETWTPSPESDPRITAVQAPNHYTGEVNDQKCEAANSAVTALKQAQADTANAKQDGAGLAAIADVVTAILLLFGVVTGGLSVLVSLILAAATVVFLATYEDFVAAFTTEAWDTVLCAIYCGTEDDISITESDWLSIKAQADDIGGIAGSFLSAAINAMGRVGLQNAMRAGLGGELSCEGCDCGLCDCDIFNWHWAELLGGDSYLSFDRSPEECAIRADTYSDTPGQYYWSIDSEECCKVFLNLVAGSVTSFMGYIPCDYEGPYSIADESVGWVGHSFPFENVECKAVMLHSFVPFTVNAVLTAP